MRRYVFGLGALLLLAMAWYLNDLLAAHGWAELDTTAECLRSSWGARDAYGDCWRISSGWAALWLTWPLTLLGVLVGGIPSVFLMFRSWQYATDHDHRREIASCEARAMEAEHRATQADAVAITQANARVAAREEELTRLQQQAEIEIAVGRAAQQEAREQIADARDKMNVANSATMAAERKAANAAAGYSRIKDKLESIKEKLNSTSVG